MRKVFLFLLLGTSVSFAQEGKYSGYNKVSVEGGFGFNKATTPFTAGYSNSLLNMYHLELGGRYMLNNKFGLMVQAGYDKMSEGKNSLAFSSQFLQFNVQGVFNFTPILDLNTISERIGLFSHVGVGVGALSGDEFKFLRGADNVALCVFGITPQFKVSEKLSIYSDLSFAWNYLQQYNWDFKTVINNSAIDGHIGKLSFGISYKLGSNEKHLDYVYDNPVVEDLTALEQKVRVLEQELKDDDKDGVLNKYDIEPNTTEGATVDTRGKEVKKVVEETIDTVKQVVEVVKEIEQIKETEVKERIDVHKLPEEFKNAKDINGMKGLFFTVQVGAYNYYMKVPGHKKLEDVYRINLPNGKIRFCTGIFGSDSHEAYQLVYHARAVGFPDAFLTAYYLGERIPIYVARKLLKEKGTSIVDPAALKK